MRKRLLILALASTLLVMLNQTATAKAKRNHLLDIQSPVQQQVCLQDTVEIVVALKNGADPATFQAWLNSRDISDRFTLEGSTLRAVVGPADGLRTYSEIIETTRDDKGVWFIDGHRHKLHAKQPRYNRLRTKVRGIKQGTGVDARTFKVDCSLFNTFEAMGYAVASDRLWQMELYRRTARGRLAEIFGADQLESDKMMRTIGYSDAELTAGFAALDTESRAVIAGYVAGINRHIAEISGTPLLPFEFVALGFTPEDWSVEDVLAWCALLQREFDPEALDDGQLDNAALLEHLVGLAMDRLGSPDPEALPVQQMAMAMFQDLRWPNDPQAQTYIVDMAAFAADDDMDGTLRHVPGLEEACDRLKKRRENVNENLKKINAKVKMGSYAWVVSGKKTASGNPIIYSGPQMGFSVPSIVCEGSIRAAGLNVSGMTVPGIPGIIIGRTPHHAWSMQVGHAHTTDYYIEDVALADLVPRVETIAVRGGEDVTLPVFRTDNGPVVNATPVIAWRYAHWGYEFNVVKAFLTLARAESMDAFGEGIEKVAVSQHFCYADRDGNIAYWMSGRDPLRPMDTYLGPYLWFLPQGLLAPAMDWIGDELVPRSHARNPQRGFFNGWNNKTSPTYFNAFNSTNDIYGPFQRAHVIEEYLAPRDDLTFEDIRDLALNIATTDSFNGGGNPWAFVADDFKAIVTAALGADDDLDANREAALAALESWDGHFVAGGADEWVDGPYRDQGWVLMNDWLRKIIALTFTDELGPGYQGSNNTLLFNVILHAMNHDDSGLTTSYNWFTNLGDPAAPQTLEDIVVDALDTVMAGYGGSIPGEVPRGDIPYNHPLLGTVRPPTPYASRSTYAHVVEFGRKGPVRIESMFPLGESGTILMDYATGAPVFDEHFDSMMPIFDAFAPREFPLFTEVKKGKR